ncbi:hypothetical protein N0V91_010617 [Didymella pomorum]|uniref:Uncharacterized protein n=1 Tax=Didymella pomorum TaxID=749634 RepID=A0A9W8Z0X6_9PLEO|nr:hypothetical protein N0V91_010617 [Didymella pomorum]
MPATNLPHESSAMMENFLSKYLERVRRIECHLARVKKGNEEERARLQAVLEPIINSSTNDTKISKLLTVLTTLIDFTCYTTRKEVDALGLYVTMVLNIPDVAQASEDTFQVPDADVRQKLSSITTADIEKLRTFARRPPQKDWTTVIVDDNDRPVFTFTVAFLVAAIIVAIVIVAIVIVAIVIVAGIVNLC